jgi:hypothetical protein
MEHRAEGNCAETDAGVLQEVPAGLMLEEGVRELHGRLFRSCRFFSS